jgi:hypothetical protein
VLERWITVTVLGEAIGFGGAMALGRGVIALVGEPDVGPMAEILILGLSAVAGLVEGACLGLAQWLVLRRVFPRLPLRHWVLATALGAALAWVIGMSAGSHTPNQPPPAPVLAAIVVAGGLVVGALLGAAQALALRRHIAGVPGVSGVGPWILASAVGWMIGLMFAFVGVALTPEPGTSLYNVGVMVVCGAAMAIAPAIATGRVLQDLARDHGAACRH